MVNPKKAPSGARRVTIMLDKDLDKKLRDIQANRIKYEIASVSFSNVVNEMVKAGLMSRQRSKWRINEKNKGVKK